MPLTTASSSKLIRSRRPRASSSSEATRKCRAWCGPSGATIWRPTSTGSAPTDGPAGCSSPKVTSRKSKALWPFCRKPIRSKDSTITSSASRRSTTDAIPGLSVSLPANSFYLFFITFCFLFSKEFWEHHFQCRYPSSSPTPYNLVRLFTDYCILNFYIFPLCGLRLIQEWQTTCTGREKLTPDGIEFEGQLQYVSDAVLAFAYAFKYVTSDMQTASKCICDQFLGTCTRPCAATRDSARKWCPSTAASCSSTWGKSNLSVITVQVFLTFC